MDRGSSYLLSSKIFLILSNCYEIILIFLLSKSNKSQMSNGPNVKPCATINVIWISVRTVQVYYLLLFFQGKMLKSIENLHLPYMHLVMQLTIDDRYNQTAYGNSWTLEARVGRCNLDAGLWTVDSGRWTLDPGHLPCFSETKRYFNYSTNQKQCWQFLYYREIPHKETKYNESFKGVLQKSYSLGQNSPKNNNCDAFL